MTHPTADKTKPYFPLAGLATDGFSNDEYATATCYCGAVQLRLPLRRPGLVTAYHCHCADCRKMTSSTTGATAIAVRSEPPFFVHLRGEDNLTEFASSGTTATGASLTSFFCKTCGSWMYRRTTSAPDLTLVPVGPVDDFSLAEGVFKPRREQFVMDRVGWACPAEGAKQIEGPAFGRMPKPGWRSGPGEGGWMSRL